MATETNESAHDLGNNSLTLGLAMLAGLGVIFMIVGAGYGVVEGESANNEVVGFLIIGGTAMLLTGAFAWGGIKRPWENFDDINVPMYHGHAHDHDAEEPGEVDAQQPVLAEATPDHPIH